MRRLTASVVAVAILAFAVSVMAQAKPDFSGKWVMDPAAAPAAPGGGGGGGGRGGRGGGPGFGMEFTVTQTPAVLTVTRMQGGMEVKAVYNLDGSESKNQAPGRGGAAMEQVSKATWDGAKLVITTTVNDMEQKRTLSLEGGNLVVEQTTPAGAVKIVYKKG